MASFRHMFFSTLGVAALAAAGLGQEAAASAPFQGVKANKGTVTLQRHAADWTLTLSDDFVVPDTPAPHWQLVDARGNVLLLQRLVTKGDVYHKTIAVPAYVPDLAKVQIWCAFAETLLGEATFAKVVDLQPKPALRVDATTAQFAGVKANRGTASSGRLGNQRVLTLSSDFLVPDAPAPHWQVVDGKGRTFLLQRLVAKDGKLNLTVALPAYVEDVAKVQIWCAFAETLLGEATFAPAPAQGGQPCTRQ
ncbi:MAG TPA: hypothetical protein VF384_18420 [Planctomycetota bacterium]